ncbi:MAG: hypothetical protein HKN82_15735 [Akkermansiaceae bacterium]|nr:hypothetical protein [Akkermansiaceae bacterium]
MVQMATGRCERHQPRIPLVLALFAILTGSSAAQSASADYTVEQVEYEDVRYEVVRADPAAVRLLWKDEKGRPLRTLGRARDLLERRGEQPLMIISGGVFEGEGSLIGLHVEDGEEQNELNLGDGKGNFFIKPNGVFLVREDGDGCKALIWTSSIYSSWLKVRKDQKALPLFAMQSGPMLVMRGMRNLKLDPESASKMDRNGIGIDRDGRVIFAITARGESVNLYGFAKLFESLGCKDALFLNGDIPQMVLNPKGSISSHAFGSIFAVVAPANEGTLAGDR